MKHLFNLLKVGCLILAFSLFAENAIAQTYVTTIDQASLDKAGYKDGLNMEGAVKNPDGSYTVTFPSKEKMDSFNSYMKDAMDGKNQHGDPENKNQINVSGDNNANANRYQTPALEAPSLSDGLNAGVKEKLQNLANSPIPGVNIETGAKDNLSGGNADGSGTSKAGSGICGMGGTDTTIFSQIACKVLQLLIDLRVIAYIISGFGMVAFAYAAVFNKISWKHFSQIGIGLFMLAMIGPFIEYFSGDGTVNHNLEYGNYLGGKYQGINGSASNLNCKDGNCPDTNTKTTKSKWSLKDLKGSIQSGIDMARGAYNAYQSAKATVQTVKQNADTIKNAIKNSGGGLDGILGAATQVAGATNNIMFAGKTGMNAIGRGATDIANAAQDTFATNEQRQENNNIRLNGENGKNTNAIAQWFNEGAGAQAITAAENAANTISKGAAGVGVAANAGYEGKKMGGGGALGTILGGAMAAGTAIGEGSGIVSDQIAVGQQRKATKAQQQANAQAATNNAVNIMEKGVAEHSANVRNSIGVVAQQNAANAAVDQKVNNQIANGEKSALQAYYDSAGITDRKTEYKTDLGSDVVIKKDGSAEVTHKRDDGVSVTYTKNSDGSSKSTFSDGTTYNFNSDGSVSASTASGDTNYSLSKDGSIKAVTASGKSVTLLADGTLVTNSGKVLDGESGTAKSVKAKLENTKNKMTEQKKHNNIIVDYSVKN